MIVFHQSTYGRQWTGNKEAPSCHYRGRICVTLVRLRKFQSQMNKPIALQTKLLGIEMMHRKILLAVQANSRTK